MGLISLVYIDSSKMENELKSLWRTRKHDVVKINLFMDVSNLDVRITMDTWLTKSC